MSTRPHPGRVLAVVLAAGALSGLSGCARERPTPPPQPTVVSSVQEMVAVVDRVDRANRTVVVRGPNDRPVTLEVGPRVRNFDQIRRGDRVRVRFEEAVALRMAPPGTTLSPEAGVAMARAAPGERPAGAVADVVRARVRIDHVDTANNTVTFTGPGGVQRVVRARSPEMQQFIRGLRRGDHVDAAYSEALAISVEPAER